MLPEYRASTWQRSLDGNQLIGIDRATRGPYRCFAAGGSVSFTIDKSLVSPSVTAIELTWNDSDGTQRVRTLYI